LWEPEFERARAAGVVHRDEAFRLACRGYIKPSLALPRDRIAARAVAFTLRKLRRIIQTAEKRVGLLRHPRVLQLRSRLSL
jgi:hypothetical protein